MKKVLGILALLLLCAPALHAQADAEQLSRQRRGSEPPPGEERTVTVGEVVFQEFDQQEFLFAEARSNLTAGSAVIILKGSLLWGRTANGPKRQFCDIDIAGQYCFWDDNGDGQFDRVKALSASRLENVGGSYRELWKPGDDQNRNHRWDLVYLGVGGGVLRLSAREYAGSSLAPVTQNEVTYDFTGASTVITYRAAKIEILAAGNSGLKYRVLP